MKKLITNSQSSIFSRLAVAARLVGLVAILAMANMASAQVDCNITMACNDGVQVSLDENCEALITPDMVIENPTYDNSFYTVILEDATGNELPSAYVDYTYVNQTLSVKVQLNGCAASCWGNINIEDKLPPVFNTCENYVVDCDADLAPGAGSVPYPVVVDACGPVTDIDYTDETVTNACANDFVKTVTRTWLAYDEQGNEAVCTQLLFVQKATIADVVFPPNYDDIDQPAFSCAVTIETLPNGAPTPEVTGYPSGATCPNIQTYYTDVVFDICGASKKVLRQWVVVDWCTGEELTSNQIIKIIDDKAPICSAVADFAFDISTDPGICTGTFEVPAPSVIFECSDWDYIVGYKLRDENGDPFDNPVYDNVSYNPATGLYTITELPQDTTWIVYTLTDACGNSSMCFTEVYVEDTEAPTPVCEGYTVVGLEDAGWADIFALSIDDGSFDNCDVEKYEVRRQQTSCGFSSDLQFGEKVNFCCNDVDAGYIKVELRVYDAAGNYNDCVVNVNVQDKINPTISCPTDKTLQCTQDYTDLSLTGEATGYDNCSVDVTHTDVVSLDDCGKGTITRTWKATDPQGRTATCTQRIHMIDSNPFGFNNIGWPGDMEIDGCDASTASPETLNSFPVLSNVDCSNIAVSYEDNTFYNTPEYCIKVLRHWKVVDWCNYDPQNPSFYEYTQKIGFYNDGVPTFESCEDQSFTSTNGDCQESVTLTVGATDDCTPAALLKYNYQLDVDNDGSINYNGNANTFTRTLSAGTHKVTWTVTDACDNSTTCMQTITVQDTKAPTPICIGSVVWALSEDGTTEVWASDFDLKSEAACGSDDDLTFSFNAAGTEPARTFDCSDIPNGIAAEIPLQMHVFDASGNSEYCDVILILQDNVDACLDQDGENATLGGRIVNSTNEGMLDIEVELMDMEEQAGDMNMTDGEGNYAFEQIDFYGDYAVEPYKNDDASNGVSTLDLVMIQRHILDLATLDSPYKLIAADVNGNEKITSSDLLLIRKVILGIETSFGDNTSWRFIPTTFEIEDPTDPFGFPEKVEFNELYLSDMNIDFTAIKTGDVNGNASNNAQGQDESSTRSAAKSLFVANQEFEAGQNVSVPVLANEVNEATGLQFAMSINEGLTFAGISGETLDMNNYNVNATNGMITVSWNASEAMIFSSNDVLFTLDFKATAKGSLSEVLELSSKGITAEAYDQSLNTFGLDLEIAKRNNAIAQNALYQNSPNPFKGMTSIGFDLEEKGMATIAIFDIAGKELYRVSNEFNKGYNEMSIDVQSIGATSGILYYTLRSGDFIDTKKMIIVE